MKLFLDSLDEKRMVNYFHDIRKMSFSQFESFFTQYCMDAYRKGLREGEAEGSLWTEDEVFNLLRSEGIGVDRANRIVDRLLEGCRNET